MSVSKSEVCAPRGRRNEVFANALIRAAQTVAENGISYRGFRVGAVAVVEHDGLVLLMQGTNNSPYRSAPKRCAEMHIMQQLDHLANTTGIQPFVRDMYVAGPSGLDITAQVNGLATPTLHPCGDCRQLLIVHPAFHDGTRITTTGLRLGDPIEHHTFAEMMGLYSDVVPPAISVAVGAVACESLPVR